MAIAPMGLPTPLAGKSGLVVGVLNVTPDSFSDGGQFVGEEVAVARGVELWQQGADIVDIGGESTRPGAQRVDREQELARTIPVVQQLAAAGVPVSIDTMRADVAQAAVAAGAVLVNDVSAGLADERMLPAVAELSCPYVAMHWRGHGSVMDSLADYTDVRAEVVAELQARVAAAVAAGIAADRIVVDPGIGFAKKSADNWQLLQPLPDLGLPVLVGVSRKRFIGDLLDRSGERRPVAGRDVATAVLSALLLAQGAWAVRVHDVVGTLDARAVFDRMSPKELT